MASSINITLEYQQTPNMWQINVVRVGGIKKLKTIRGSPIQCPKPCIYSEEKVNIIIDRYCSLKVRIISYPIFSNIIVPNFQRKFTMFSC